MQVLKRAFLEGAMVVLPLGAIVLLILGIVRRLEQAADPLAGRYVHPVFTAILMLAALVLLVGLLVRSAAGRRVRQALEAIVFERIPGYRLAKAFVSEGPLVESSSRAVRPALAAIEEGQCPVLVMDEFVDGRLLVFVPGSPAPMSGAIYIFAPDKVVLLDVPLLPFLRAISSWGLGLREMIEGAGAARSATETIQGRIT